MADTTNKGSLWITIGAAAATIVVILGVAIGPSVISCTGSSDGFGACMQQALVDRGILGGQDTPEVTTASRPVTEVDEPEPETTAPDTVSESVSEVEEAGGTTQDEPAKPRLGLVRAEPNGSLVIAGSAEPGAEVEIYANGELLGRVTAEASGDWVLVPDAPLPPGGFEITVSEPSTGVLAAESVVVVIQDDLSTEPLVVASTPGEASSILQGLPEADSATAVAGATEPAAEEETAPEAETLDVASADTGDASDAADAINTAAAVNNSAVLTEAPEIDVPASAQEPADAEIAVVEPSPAQQQLESDTQTAAAPMIPPSIDAVEVEGDRNFFAGSGEEGATVRLYVDNEFVADSEVVDGRWLVETSRNYLTSPNQRIRVDMLRSGSADVAARAEVNFAIDLPEPAQAPATAIASAGEPAPGAGVAEQINDAASATPSSQLASAPEIDVAETAAADTAVATETDTIGGEEEADESSAPAATPDTDAAAGMAADSAGEAETTAAADDEPAVPAVGVEVPTMTAVQVGDTEDNRFASGKAIIRKGDNLWTIATRVYGSGYRFINIYRANRDQIRNPDLIYPGQVFELPEDIEQE